MYTSLLNPTDAPLMEMFLFWGQLLLQHQDNLKMQHAMDTPSVLCGI